MKGTCPSCKLISYLRFDVYVLGNYRYTRSKDHVECRKCGWDGYVNEVTF